MNRSLGGSVRALAFASVLGAFPVFAGSEAEGVDALKGFFVGVDAAYNHSTVENDETGGKSILYDNGREEDVPGLGKVKSKRVRIEPSVNVGYSHFFGNYYLGLAGDVSFGNGRKSFVITDPDEGYETRISGVSYGIKAKGGYYLSGLKSVVYGIAGVKWRDVSYRRCVEDQFLSKAKLKSPSFLLGLGFERPVYEKLTLSAEYEYSWRSSTGGTSEVSDAYSVDMSVKQRLREHTLRIGIKYYI